MTAALPYSLRVLDQPPFSHLALLNPTNAKAKGPTVRARKPKLVTSGLLTGWSVEGAAAIQAPPKMLEVWDLSWGPAEQHFETTVHQCSTPEEVEALLPAKWIGYNVTSDVDETLSRVCQLCTALVNRCVSMSTANPPTTTAKWREHQRLEKRLKAVMELLEGSIGEDIPIGSLQDPGFVKQCWLRLSDEERTSMSRALSSVPAGYLNDD